MKVVTLVETGESVVGVGKFATLAEAGHHMYPAICIANLIGPNKGHYTEDFLGLLERFLKNPYMVRAY